MWIISFFNIEKIMSLASFEVVFNVQVIPRNFQSFWSPVWGLLGEVFLGFFLLFSFFLFFALFCLNKTTHLSLGHTIQFGFFRDFYVKISVFSKVF
jgi:hypothetical protein